MDICLRELRQESIRGLLGIMAFKTLTVSFVFALAVLSTFPGQAAYLKPQDFGIQVSDRGLPVGELLLNVALGNFDNDGYQDMAIILGDTINGVKTK